MDCQFFVFVLLADSIYDAVQSMYKNFQMTKPCCLLDIFFSVDLKYFPVDDNVSDILSALR